MLKIGQEEVDALAKVILGGDLFRYHKGGTCETFEKRYGEYIGASHVSMCSSGTASLVAALAGLGIGPGDEVIVPAHTFMASALAVLAVGAIPVVVDIDESIMLSPDALEDAIGPHTKAVMPVHMWGALCDMDRILDIAKRHDLRVVEDACQCVGGFYKGRGAGAMGDAGAYSFNFFKNMTSGEGGAVVTNDESVHRRARCMIDPCSFFWEGREDDFCPFANCGSRASEIQGAMLHIQLDRLPELIDILRASKARLLEAVTPHGLTPVPCHSTDGEVPIRPMFTFATTEEATQFGELAGGGILRNTGRHTYTEWDQVLSKQGSHHRDLNPYNMPQNKRCRMDCTPGQCQASLDILARTAYLTLDPDANEAYVQGKIDACLAALEKMK